MINIQSYHPEGGRTLLLDPSSSNDLRHLQPVFGPDDSKFQHLKTVIPFVLEMSLAIGVFIVAIAMTVAWPKDKEQCEPYFILLYIHGIFWFFSLLIDQHAKNKHHQLRVNGYLEFYQQTNVHFRVPYYIVTLWHIGIMFISTVFNHVYDDFKKQCIATGFFKPITYLCIFIGVEILVLFPFIFSYLMKVVRFNSAKPPPDVLREELISGLMQENFATEEVGIRNRNDHIEDLLEKQADLIRYLKEHNAKLSQKIMALTMQLQNIQ